MARSPLSVHPYLWAIGPTAAKLAPPRIVGDRYKILAPQVWQDLYPAQLPDFPEQVPDRFLPYLRLYPQRLHVPEMYGFCALEDTKVILLHNAPIDAQGELLPSLGSQWQTATPLRQSYWLWQMLELWPQLQKEGVATSLLVADNLRVEGGRIRLIELLRDRQPFQNLAPLVKLWLPLSRNSHYSIAATLENIVAMLQQPNPSPTMIRRTLNHLLLEQAAQYPLAVQVASATDSGAEQLQNEDAVYPSPGTPHPDPHVLVVCDGIGGHAEGAIASQSAIQSLQLQARAVIQELQADPTRLEPEMVTEQLLALVKIVNNLIATRNDQQNRSARQRMATTAILALQLPQVIETPENRGNSHELYLVHIGDSRAYWLTETYCQCLTVDHDIIRREVCKGEALPLQARQRPDAGALTQALGTRGGDRLHPTIQRFVIEEDGILLLCSDGLSDRYLLERCWTDVAPEVLRGTMTLQVAVDYLVQLARQHNGHDNISIVAALYGVQRQSAAVTATAPSVATPPAELLTPVAQLDQVPEDSRNGSGEPLFLETEPLSPNFTNLEDVENLLLELTQPQAPPDESPTDQPTPQAVEPSPQAEPELTEASMLEEIAAALEEPDPPEAPVSPVPELETAEAAESDLPAPTPESDTDSDLPLLPPPSPNAEPESVDPNYAYAPNSELPEMVPTWDNPNPWAANTPPPYQPEPLDNEPVDPEAPSPAALFADVPFDEMDESSEGRERLEQWLPVIGLVILVALMSGVVVLLQHHFTRDQAPQEPRLERED